MELTKTTELTTEVTYNGKSIATLRTSLRGDGTTPIVQVIGTGNIVGFADDGTPLIDKNVDKKIAEAQTDFMAEAIKVQKQLTEENGLNPNTVNFYNA